MAGKRRMTRKQAGKVGGLMKKGMSKTLARKIAKPRPKR